MSLKDRFDRFIDYFTEDEDLSLPNEKRDEPILTPVNSTQAQVVQKKLILLDCMHVNKS